MQKRLFNKVLFHHQLLDGRFVSEIRRSFLDFSQRNGYSRADLEQNPERGLIVKKKLIVGILVAIILSGCGEKVPRRFRITIEQENLDGTVTPFTALTNTTIKFKGYSMGDRAVFEFSTSKSEGKELRQ